MSDAKNKTPRSTPSEPSPSPHNSALAFVSRALLWLAGLAVAGTLGVLLLVALALSMAYPNLPDISGLELLRHLKLDPGTRGIPVIVVSADALPTQIDEALQAGAHRYLTKPVNVGELLEALDELLAVMETRFDDLGLTADS